MASDQGRGDGLRRQESNWVQQQEGEEMASPPAEHSSPVDLSEMLSMLSAVESQVLSLETAMNPRSSSGSGSASLAGAYGRQSYQSLGSMLRQVQAASTSMADRLQVLAESAELPEDVLARSSGLRERIERALLVHRARCPPQELGNDDGSGHQQRRQLSSPQQLGRVVRRRIWRATPEEGGSSSHDDSNERRLSRRESVSAPAEGGAATNRSGTATEGGGPLARTRTLEDLVIETDEHACEGGSGGEENEDGGTSGQRKTGDDKGDDVAAATASGSTDPRTSTAATPPTSTPTSILAAVAAATQQTLRGSNCVGNATNRPSPMDIVRRQSTHSLATEASAMNLVSPRSPTTPSGAPSEASQPSTAAATASEAASMTVTAADVGGAGSGEKDDRGGVGGAEMRSSGSALVVVEVIPEIGEGKAEAERKEEKGGGGVEGEGGTGAVDGMDVDDEAEEEGEGTSIGDERKGDLDGTEVLESDRMSAGPIQVYSWGRGDLGALLQADDGDHSVNDGPVPLKEHWSVLQVSTALFHTMAVTASGDVIGCGQNDEGQVRPDLPAEEIFTKPSLVEPILSHRVTQVSCGLYHTACVTAAGVALTWGGNESGQLGHSPDMTRKVRPMAVQVSGAGTAWSSSRRAARVACGDLFTLILTSRAEVLSCGVGECVGGDGTDRKQAALVQSLAGFPAVLLACGNSHSIVIGADGEAVAFGLNTHGQLGIGDMAEGDEPAVLSPRPVVGTCPEPVTSLPDDTKPASTTTPNRASRVADAKSSTAAVLDQNGAAVGTATATLSRRGGGGGGTIPPQFLVARAACGQSHTVFVSKSGEAWVCGRNRSGQLGLDPASTPAISTPVRLLLATTGSFPSGTSSSPSGTDPPPSGTGDPSLTGADPSISGTGSRNADVVEAAAGRAHTLLLCSDGRLLGFGSDEFGGAGGAVAGGGAEGSESGAKQSTSWRPREIRGAWPERWVAAVSAGGEQSFALTLPVDEAAAAAAGSDAAPVATSGAASGKAEAGAPWLRPESAVMTGRRGFPVPPAACRMRSAADFLELIRRVPTQGEGGGGSRAGSPEELALLEAIRQTFGSPAVLSGSFKMGGGLRSDGGALKMSRLDAEGLSQVYNLIVGLGGKFIAALASSVEQGLATVAGVSTTPPAQGGDKSVPPPVPLRAGVSCLLKYWQSPTLGLVQLDASGKDRKDAFLRLCAAVLELRAPARWRLLRSVKEDYPSEIFSEKLVKPMLDGLARYLRVNRGRGSGVPGAALILKWLHSINELEAKVPYQAFFSDAVSTLPVESLLTDLHQWRVTTPEGRKNRFFFAEHAFLLSTESKKAMLKAEGDMEQRKAAEKSVMRFVAGVGLVFNPFLVLQVHRDHLLQETLQQVSHIADMDLRKKLKVVFAGEEGVDEGGVAKEFFQLLTVQLFDQSFGMFVPAGEEGRSLWFNKDCVWADEEYGLVGLLVGLAVYAGVLLDVPFPHVVFRKLLGQQLTLKDLGDIDPDLLQGLQKMIDYDGDDVEDIFAVDFTVTWDDLGVQRTHELKSGGKDIPVTSANKEEYVELYANFLLVESVTRQFNMFQRGFMRVMGGAHSISLLRAEELEVLVTGLSELDFGELSANCKYDGGYSADHPTIKAFWSAVKEMPTEEQKRLLMFATGSKKAPLGGLGKMDFTIQRAGPDTDHLPTSHTCFNVLVLPEYTDAEKLKRLLKRAITECEGFGLK